MTRRFIAHVRLSEDVLPHESAGGGTIAKGTAANHVYTQMGPGEDPVGWGEQVLQETLRRYHWDEVPHLRNKMEVVMEELPAETAVTLQTVLELPVLEREVDVEEQRSLLNIFAREMTFSAWDRTSREMDMEGSPFTFTERQPQGPLSIFTIHWDTKPFAVLVFGERPRSHDDHPQHLVFVVDTDLSFRAVGEIVTRTLRGYTDEDVQQLRPYINLPLACFDVARLQHYINIYEAP